MACGTVAVHYLFGFATFLLKRERTGNQCVLFKSIWLKIRRNFTLAAFQSQLWFSMLIRSIARHFLGL
jgi:hypothetical protein